VIIASGPVFAGPATPYVLLVEAGVSADCPLKPGQVRREIFVNVFFWAAVALAASGIVVFALTEIVSRPDNWSAPTIGLVFAAMCAVVAVALAGVGVVVEFS
jgi:hypothetical protein